MKKVSAGGNIQRVDDRNQQHINQRTGGDAPKRRARSRRGLNERHAAQRPERGWRDAVILKVYPRNRVCHPEVLRRIWHRLERRSEQVSGAPVRGQILRRLRLRMTTSASLRTQYIGLTNQSTLSIFIDMPL